MRFAISGRLDRGALAAALAPSWRIVGERGSEVVRRYLDTFDWALWRNGGRLVLESEGSRRRIRWQPGGGGPARTAPLAGEVRFASDLPGGVLGREVADAAGTRALLPVGEVRVRRRLRRVTDGEGKTLVRLWLEDVQAVHDGTAVGPEKPWLHVEPLVGYSRVGARVLARLREHPGLTPAEGDDLADAAAAAGRTPGDYTSKITVRLHPEEPAERAVRRILAGLLSTLAANVEGTVRDLDSEFLHDLRVATRRTRTCLGQLRDVLPSERVEPFVEEFRWIGDATTPCRDLDVFLADAERRRAALAGTAAAALDPLLGHLRTMREGARRELVEALGSERFERLVRRWRVLLARPLRGGGEGALPIGDVAAARVLRAYRRLVRHGRALAGSARPPEMHRLRIDGKKLRYLLEFFASLWDGDRNAALIDELKLVQDTLGAYHDAWLQEGRLAGLGEELLAAGAGAGTLLAMGQLQAELVRRQAREAQEFFARFARFSSRAVRDGLSRLVQRGGSAPCA